VPFEIKTIGGSGQISLGKQHAGRTVMVDEIETGVWVPGTAQVIPDNELWLHSPEAQESLDKVVEWSAASSRAQSDLGLLSRKIRKLK
jgi:hypothetical protein